ncbi:MAG TPA: hydrogenase maturation nickel metallochaperone HypA [Anaeromyxobacteraceae bacterium]|nr:hydrogenase maturation nickel metallochaperone HypA [Anaeromyxobacteraceae bacterium]
MHELSIAEGIVDAIRERTGDARVARVFLEIGKLSCIEPEAVRFCFELCARGTGVQGASLEIDEVAGRACCRGCGAQDVAIDGAIPLCACGSADLHVVAGDRMLVTAVELA